MAAHELEEGEKAPDFELMTHDGRKFRLYEELKSGPIVLYFYPKDFTPGCTTEACEFRDRYDTFVKNGYRVFGVSSDPPEVHMRFAEQYRLPFTLLSDTEGKVRKLFGVKPTFGLFPGRTTFVIKQDGTIAGKFSSQFRPADHPERISRIIHS